MRKKSIRGYLFILYIIAAFTVIIACFNSDAAAYAASGLTENSVSVGRKTVRVGLPDMDTSAATKGGDNRNVAYTKDYVKAVAEYADWDCEFVAEPWADCIKDVEDGNLDVLTDVSITEDRMDYLDYSSEPMGSETCYMYGSGDTKLGYGDFEAFNGITVGYEEGSTIIDTYEEYAGRMGFTFKKKPYVSGAAMFAGLDAGEVDAIVQTNMYDTPSGHVILAKCSPSPVYMVTTRKKPELKQEMDEAMAQLFSYKPSFNADIFEYHFKGVASQVSGYTTEEKAYLEKHPVVDVYYETSWEPFEYERKGEAAGITPDIIRAIGKDTGIEFRFVLESSTDAIYDKTGKATADTLMAVSYDYSWADEHDLLVTQPYVTGSVMRVTKTGRTVPDTVAIVKGGYLANEIANAYPNMKPVEYMTFAECMKAVKSGEADCTFLNYYQASYYRSMNAYAKFTYVPSTDITQNISLGVTKDSDPALLGILSKSLQRISSGTEQSILNDNSIHEDPFTFYRLVTNYPIQTAALLGIIILVTGMLIVTAVNSSNRKKQNAMLAEAKNEAENANKAKSEFLSRMSHDMRTPLNGIMGMTYIANEQNNPEKTSDCLKKINTSSQFLLGLINDVLDMTKMESGMLELHPEPYRLEDFRNYIESVVRPLCEIKHQDLEFITDPENGITPVTDILRMNQIYFNLLSNASKYTAERGTITVKVTGSLINDSRERVTASVKDNGIGMSEKFQKVLFEPFTQENEDDRAEMHGSGLGLAIVKKIIDAMGGTISVYSRKGEGTEFKFVIDQDYIRTDELADRRRITAQSDASVKLAGKHVLLCEDNLLNQEIAMALLKDRNAQADCAENGLKGTEMFSASDEGYYDAVLMDIHMPVMNGYTAAHIIRSMDRSDAATVPIIAMTADAFAEDVKKCMDNGMNGHISKPVEPEKFYEILVKNIF